jgi:hypothetical protein
MLRVAVSIASYHKKHFAKKPHWMVMFSIFHSLEKKRDWFGSGILRKKIEKIKR